MASIPKHRPHRDVLADLLADPSPTAAPAAVPAAADGTPRHAGAARRAERFTINLAPELIDRLRSAVRNSRDLTLSGLAAMALEHEVQRLEELRGEPFPPYRRRLPAGRPVR